MPSTSWTKTIDDNKFKFEYIADQAQQNGYTLKLSTENKFVDKDIWAKVIIPEGSLTASTGSVALTTIGADGLLGNAVTTQPSQGGWIYIAGSGVVTVTSAGWLTQGATASSSVDAKYYPIKSASITAEGGIVYCKTAGYIPQGSSNTALYTFNTVTPTTTASYSGMTNYFTGTTAGGSPNVTITPKYKTDAGYVVTKDWTGNGGVSYWEIKSTTINSTSMTTKNNGTEIDTQAGLTWNEGWINNGSITAATFSATYTGDNNNYVDISETNAAPALVANSYLYINAGYTSNVKISLEKLIPGDASITGANGTTNKVLQGVTVYDSAGNLLTGTIESLTAATYYTATADRTVTAGKYLSGELTIKAVTTTGIDKANIRSGKTIKVGDTSSAGRIKNITGTFSAASTVTSATAGISVTAASAASIREGYSAFLNGSQLDGTMPDVTVSTTFTVSNITKYFNSTTVGGSPSVTITPNYINDKIGYLGISAGTHSGTAVYYKIKTATLSATAGSVTLVSNSTSASGSLPFSIYTSSNAHGINIVTGTTEAIMGSNKVFIQIKGTGAVAASTTGWVSSTAAVSSTTATRYISMDYYTGSYSTA